MPSNNTHPTISTSCLDQEQLLGLAENKLNPAEAQALREHVSQCPLCKDALEGLQLVEDPEQLPGRFAQLDREVLKKSGGAAQPPINWKPLYSLGAIAAMLLIVFLWAVPKFTEEGEGALAQESASAEERKARELSLPERESAHASSPEKDTPSEEPPPEPTPRPREAVQPRANKAAPEKDVPQKAPAPVYSEDEDDSKAESVAEREVEEAEEKATVEMKPARPTKLSPPPVSMMPYRHPDFSAQQNQLMQQGRQAFNIGDYQEAERHFKALLRSMPQSRVANYLAGLNALYLQDAGLAKSRLLIVAKRRGEMSFESVNWPSVLDLLRAGDIAQAKRQLELYSQKEGLIRLR